MASTTTVTAILDMKLARPPDSDESAVNSPVHPQTARRNVPGQRFDCAYVRFVRVTAGDDGWTMLVDG